MTCGEGHNSIAKALKQEFNEQNVENEIVDIFRSNIKKLNMNNKGYLFCVKHFPHIYQAIWKREKRRNPNLRYEKGIYNNSIDSVIGDIENEIKTYKPNSIICTHDYASGIVSKLRHFGKIDKNIKLYSILTDFFPHPYWESSIDIDKVFIPYSCGIEQLKSKGFRDDQIIETGVPLKEIFYKEIDKQEIRKKLGIEDKFTLIITSGGFGTGKNNEIVKLLLKSNLDIQIININGRNEKSKRICDKLIQKAKATNVHNLGFSSNMDELISASDLMISKGGCLTISESICKKVPLLIRENVIINEVENADYLEKENICIRLKSIREIPTIIKNMLEDKSIIMSMQKNCEKLIRPSVTKKICSYVVNPKEK